jgi:hypothetical protein
LAYIILKTLIDIPGVQKLLQKRGALKQTGENVEIIWAKFSTLSFFVLILRKNACLTQTDTHLVL